MQYIHTHKPISISICKYQQHKKASLLIFANKQDLINALNFKEIAKELELNDSMFSNRHWNIVGCSAVTGEGLVDGVDWIVRDIANRIFLMD